MEVACRRQALALAARLLAQHLNADTSDDAGPWLPCSRCGGLARYAGRPAKTFTTALGPLPLTRAYYHCAACAQGFCPRDRALGLEATALSPAVTRMVGTAAALVSFAESSELLGALAGLPVTAKQVERTAEALGFEMAADERQQVVAAAAAEIAPTLYLGLDGTGVPMRKAELAGRPGKQADGTAKTREVKLCTVWSAEGRDADGVPVRDAGSVSYSAAIERAATRDTDATGSAFAQRVEREARRRGFDRAPRQVVLGDGAPWIWNLAGEYFPEAIQIVDRFHVKEHLSGVAKVLYGAPSDLGDAWAKARHDDLDAGHLHRSWLPWPPSTARAATPPSARRSASASATSGRIAAACATRPSAPRGSAPPPPSWRPGVRWPSARGSSAPACTGASGGRTRSSPCAAAS